MSASKRVYRLRENALQSEGCLWKNQERKRIVKKTRKCLSAEEIFLANTFSYKKRSYRFLRFIRLI